MAKKKWVKPELTELIVGKPEESVLAGCKREWGGGPNYQDNDCANVCWGGCGGWGS